MNKILAETQVPVLSSSDVLFQFGCVFHPPSSNLWPPPPSPVTCHEQYPKVRGIHWFEAKNMAWQNRSLRPLSLPGPSCPLISLLLPVFHSWDPIPALWAPGALQAVKCNNRNLIFHY